MRYTLLMLILVLLTGCGSKGALFLPSDKSATAQPAATQPEAAQPAQAAPTDETPPAEQKKKPKKTEEEPIPQPVQEIEDDEDINL